MKYEETGFRALYHHFCAFKLNDKIRPVLDGFPGSEEAEYVLAYGYIDVEAGLTLDVLAAAKKRGDAFDLANTLLSTHSIIRIGTVKDEDFYYFEDEDGTLQKRYAEKLDMLSNYDADPEVEQTRDMRFLDSCRHPEYPDDIQVYLVKDDLNPEACWVRIIGLGDHFIMGTLLDEPFQDFGYHKDERIAFFVQKDENDQVFCYSDMNPSQKLKPEDLEDGSMLRNAIATFRAETTNEHFIDIMEILRDSYIWIPCSAILSEEDQKAWGEILEKAGNDLDQLVGMEMTSKEDIRMVPDILQHGDGLYFPAFISCEDMGEYGEHFSKVQRHFLEAISLARNNKKEVKGIVLNAFTDPLIIDREIWDLIEGMKTRIV